jgi:hypothetical protein
MSLRSSGQRLLSAGRAGSGDGGPHAERAAIADARRGAFVSDGEAAAFWKRHGFA